MLHLVLYALLAIIVAGGLFLAATRFLPAGEQIAPALRDEPVWELPAERSLHAEDIDHVRLPVALRGYRFAETDILLDRLSGELRARDAEIARLRGYPAAAPDAAESDSALPEDARLEDARHEDARHEDAQPEDVRSEDADPGPAVGEFAEDRLRFGPPPVGDERG